MNKTDLPNVNDLYYVGDIADIDGSLWVDEETAEMILIEYKAGVI